MPSDGGFAPPAGATPRPATANPHQMDWGRPSTLSSDDPGNGVAVAGFVLAVASLVFLVLSVGLATIVSLGMGIAGIVCGQKGRTNVKQEVTAQHRELATASLWVGIAATVLSSLATIFWIAVLVDGIANGAFDTNGTGETTTPGGGAPPTLRTAIALACLVAG